MATDHRSWVVLYGAARQLHHAAGDTVVSDLWVVSRQDLIFKFISLRREEMKGGVFPFQEKGRFCPTPERDIFGDLSCYYRKPGLGLVKVLEVLKGQVSWMRGGDVFSPPSPESLKEYVLPEEAGGRRRHIPELILTQSEQKHDQDLQGAVAQPGWWTSRYDLRKPLFSISLMISMPLQSASLSPRGLPSAVGAVLGAGSVLGSADRETDGGDPDLIAKV